MKNDENRSLWWCVCSALAGLATLSAHPGFASQTAETGSTNSLTLNEAVRLALEYNPALRASGARVTAAAGRAYQASQWTNPELELSAEDWPVSNDRGFSDAKQTIGVAQSLPYPGKKSLDRRVGSAGVRVSEAELAVLRTEVVRNVKAAFWKVLASERLVDVSTQLVVVAELSATTARKRVDAGATAYQEQLRAEVVLERARTELAEYQRELAIARQVLAEFLGRPDLAEATFRGGLAEVPDEALLEQGIDGWLEAHPSVAAGRAQVDQATLNYRRTRLEPYPDVKVAVSGGRIGETDESIIQLGFSLPIPILDQSKGKQQEARANVSVAEAELQAVRQQLQREWANAQIRYRTAVEQAKNYRDRILPKAEEALRLVRIGFDEGKFNFIDLVDTQRTTAETRLAYQQKLLELNVAQAELEALFQPQPLKPSQEK